MPRSICRLGNIGLYTVPFRFCLALLCLVVLTTGSGHTQNRNLTVKVPFDYFAGEHSFRAGTCTIERPVGIATGTKQRMALSSGKQSTFVATRNLPHSRDLSGLSKSQLVFHHYGDKYFLREVWINGTAAEVVPSGEETRLSESAEPKVVVLVVKH
jgi:hypothetical protein